MPGGKHCTIVNYFEKEFPSKCFDLFFLTFNRFDVLVKKKN